jgi:hypothetical protein
VCPLLTLLSGVWNKHFSFDVILGDMERCMPFCLTDNLNVNHFRPMMIRLGSETVETMVVVGHLFVFFLL